MNGRHAWKHALPSILELRPFGAAAAVAVAVAAEEYSSVCSASVEGSTLSSLLAAIATEHQQQQ